MGHLINPISLQVKYHGSWKLGWNQYLKKDFAYFFFLDNYIKNVLNSIVSLKSFLNKFFFYELKYFLKNDIILFYFSFKCISKTYFNFYWGYTYPFYLFANFPKFKKKHKYQESLQKKSLIHNTSTLSLVEKYNFIKMPSVMTDHPKNMTLKKLESLFPLRSEAYSDLIGWRTASLNLELSKNTELTAYAVNSVFLESSKLRLAVLQQMVFKIYKNFTGNAFSMFLNVTRIHMDKVKSLAISRFLRNNISRGIFYSIIEGEDIIFDKANPQLDLCKLPPVITLWRSWFKKYCYLFLQKYTEYAAQKFRMTFKVKRRFISAKLRLEMKSFLKEISNFLKDLRGFIYGIQVFFQKESIERENGSILKSEWPNSLFFFKQTEIDLFKKEFFIVIDKKTRNYVLLKWLTKFYIKIAMQYE